jgi:hypothetical protein
LKRQTAVFDMNFGEGGTNSPACAFLSGGAVNQGAPVL